MVKERLKDLETPLLDDGPDSLNRGEDAKKGKDPPSVFTENKVTETKMDSQMEMFKKIA
jgi:Na+-driven multidrug efflux pump